MSRTYGAAMGDGRALLAQAGIATADRDALRLLAHAAGWDVGRLSIELGQAIPPDTDTQFQQLLAQRAAGRPVAKITGWRDFWAGRFRVTDDVLDPRPDTETLVEAALARPFQRVLDLGTGTGCIVLSLLAERPGATGVGCDISAAALDVARANAADHGLTARVTFVHSDWFSDIEGQFDLVVSNPPYIALAEMPDLAVEVRNHDPFGALSDGGDGLGAYRSIAVGIGRVLRPGGALIVEIGPSQAGAVVELFQQAGLTQIAVLPDLDGRDRVVCAKAP